MRISAVAVLVGAFCIPALSADPAVAQATRTWVSGVGDDVNPCSRTAPCKTFAGAISRTAVGGEINCLDPGGFGSVTITKAITIDCGGTFGSILASSVNGVIVNAGASDIVTIRNISINGAGNGLNGIRFLSGGVLNVENVAIFGFRSAAPNGNGIQFVPGASAEVYVRNISVHDNGAGGTAAGILIAPTGSGFVRAVVTNSRIESNNSTGIRAAGGTNLTLVD